MKTTTVPERAQVPAHDMWDITSLYDSPKLWEHDVACISAMSDALAQFQGKLAHSFKSLLEALTLYAESNRLTEKAGNYAFLLTAADSGNAENQAKYERFTMICTQAAAKTSFFIPEIQAIPDSTLQEWLKKSEFDDYRVWVIKLLRLKPHILSEKEERIFALHMNADETAHKAFSLLTNLDIDYGTISYGEKTMPLTQSSWSVFMESPDRELRKTAYMQFYDAFDKHKNTIAALYAGSVHLDVCNARARNYASARQAALFADNVSENVYDSLISAVRAHLKPLHRYYALRKRILGLDKTADGLRHYDVYVPLISSVKKVTPYNDAVDIIIDALKPLGSEYTNTLRTGLTSGWVDKYENKGKRSGAFSSGGYTGYPYILMNYKEDVLRDVFTLAHEAGHSMHSHYSARSNPYLQYGYTIFEAEVASTFNEELLFQYMLKNETDTHVRTYLLCNRASDILATLYRQTMFAEYEKITHAYTERGEPLTTETLRKIYRGLLDDYFGPQMTFETVSDLEGLRIPHFYSAFYVYKYATGISASLALAERVLNGGKKEHDDYFAFLKSGGSRYPIDSLAIAGVNMATTAPIEAACARFSSLVEEIEKIKTT